jgi:hypothetical protein
MAATPKPRSTPGINQPTVNKTYKNTANSSSYLGNVGKEVKQFARAVVNTQIGDRNAPDAVTAARINSENWKKYDSAFGQLGGAIFKGRKYDDKTGKRVR